MEASLLLNNNQNWFLPYNDVLPLWKLNGHSYSTYRQFQVFASKGPEDYCSEDGNSAIIYEKYKCALCNTDVPTMYRKEHDYSSKHKTSVEIVVLALERVTANVSIVNSNLCVKKTSNTYFCETCAVPVKDRERNEHESSEAHQKSVLCDRLLNDLKVVYKNRDLLGTVDFSYLNTNKNDGVITNMERLVLKHDITKNENSTTNNIPISSETVGNGNFSSTENDKDMKHNTSVAKDVQPRLFSLPSSNTVVASLSSDAPVPAIKKTPNTGKQYCGSCDLHIDFHNYSIHLSSKKHAKKLALASSRTETESQSREAKPTTKVSQTEVHTSSNSVRTSAFKINTNTNMGIDTKVNILVVDNKLNPEAKNTAKLSTADDKDNTVETEYKTTVNKNTTVKSQLNTTIGLNTETKDSNVTKLMNEIVHYHFRIIDDILVDCRVCLTKVPNHINNMNEHLNGFRHKTAFDSLLSENKIKKLANQQLYCEYCKINIAVAKEIDHITFEGHRLNKLEAPTLFDETEFNTALAHTNYQTSEAESFTPEGTTYASVSEIAQATSDCYPSEPEYDASEPEYYESEPEYEESEPEYDASEPEYDASEPEYDASEPEYDASEPEYDDTDSLHHHLQLLDDKTVYCVVCDAHIPCVEKNINEHLNGGRHRINYENLLTKSIDKQDKQSLNESFKTTKTLHYHLQLLNDRNLYCRVCGAVGSNNTAFEHLNGNAHRRAYSNLLSKNKITKLTGNEFYCKECDVTIEFQKELNHIVHIKHQSKAKSNTCETNVVEALHSHLKMIENKVCCLVCETGVPNNDKNINEHLNGERHRKNFNNMLSNNEIKQLENNQFYCGVCKRYVGSKKQLDHIMSAEHKSKTADAKSDTAQRVDNTAVTKPKTIGTLHSQTNEITETNNNKKEHKVSAENKKESAGAKVNNTPHHFKIVDDDLLMCKVCKHLMYNFEYTDHLKSDVHLDNYAKILHENKLYKQTSKGLKCKACSEFVLKEDDLTHIETEKHVIEVERWNAVTREERGNSYGHYVCGLCEVEFPFTPINIKHHEAAEIHKAKLKEIQNAKDSLIATAMADTDLIVPTRNANEMECTLCKVRMHYGNVTDHLVGAKHKKQIKCPRLSFAEVARGKM